MLPQGFVRPKKVLLKSQQKMLVAILLFCFTIPTEIKLKRQAGLLLFIIGALSWVSVRSVEFMPISFTSITLECSFHLQELHLQIISINRLLLSIAFSYFKYDMVATRLLLVVVVVVFIHLNLKHSPSLTLFPVMVMILMTKTCLRRTGRQEKPLISK